MLVGRFFFSRSHSNFETTPLAFSQLRGAKDTGIGTYCVSRNKKKLGINFLKGSTIL